MKNNYSIKRFSYLFENLFSSSINYKSFLGYSLSSCIDLVKCMEFYHTQSNQDISHWIGDVVCSYFDRIKTDGLYGSTTILYSLSDEELNLLDNENFKTRVRNKYPNPVKASEDFMNSLWNEKLQGKYKYRDLLKNGFYYSSEIYSSFFYILGKVLNFQITLSDLENYLWDIDRISGKIFCSNELYNFQNKKTLLESKISKKEFENLIYGTIFLVKHQELPKNNIRLYNKFRSII